MRAAHSPARVRAGHVAWMTARLSERDQQIIATVNRLHLVTAHQLERLHFAGLAVGRSRTVSRSRVLARLVRWRVLLPLPRRIGVLPGSSVTTYALDTAGVRLLQGAVLRDGQPVRIRRPGPPGERFVRHTVAVAELFTLLTEAERTGGLRLRRFEAEPRWPDGLGGWLRPDAYLVLTDQQTDYLFWVEVDLATESLPTVRRKLAAYLDFLGRGGHGPRGAMPRVMVVADQSERRTAVATLIASLPPPASDLFHVATFDEITVRLAQIVPP